MEATKKPTEVKEQTPDVEHNPDETFAISYAEYDTMIQSHALLLDQKADLEKKVAELEAEKAKVQESGDFFYRRFEEEKNKATALTLIIKGMTANTEIAKVADNILKGVF